MATTAPDGLISPDASDPYDLTSDMAAMQASTQAALTNRSSKSGSNSSMLNASGVQIGTLWYNTSEDRLYRFNGTGWDAVAPAQVVPDTVNMSSSISSGYSGTIRARILGGITQLSFSLQANTNFGPASSVSNVAALPSGRARPVEAVYTGAIFTTSGAGFASGTARITAGGVVSVNPARSTDSTVAFSFTFVH